MEAQLTHLDALHAAVQPVAAHDTMAEAGRKVLLLDLIKMLENEDGSRSGEDIEHVHDMRVSTRRMRSALRLLAPYYKPKTARSFRAQLKKIADALGAVRDLDVLIDDLGAFGSNHQADLSATIALLDSERQQARRRLHRALDRGRYARFVSDFSAFLTTPGSGARSLESDGFVAPSQVRHVLPTLVYEHLGSVRAYDAVIDQAELETLHALRIEFKRLRYLVTFFSDILGTSAKDFITELKAIQDHLGRMNDIHVASERLADLLPDLEDDASAALSAYLDSLDSELEAMRAKFPEVWKRFNSTTIQKKVATALVAL
jgi:CHAD domain-containing protein